ncbi:phage baseplate plug family protein [Rhizobium sp. 11515TR]|uniref:phage baseplate plug family protein n=1 Tax=Rhizobium sp. 11515TR TaxID=2028343 RepID=UPI000BA852A1|nr:hypothetical protein [Rhizobium sp. 11515TR]ASW06309.1 hypothetical protein CKA34_10725 [Rhizobium sp. 11515TR]
MLIVPLQAVPNQTVTVTLNDQVTQINVYQTYNGLFIDVYLENDLIIGGVICENQNRIIRSAYLGYSGDFAFIDMQGANDPDYTGLGTRYFLAYLSETELS